MASDHELVNFQQEHELNYHLRSANKKQTEANRAVLQTLGAELKKAQNARVLTHKDFSAHIQKNLHKLT